jgi:hypothetical protein
MGILKLANFVRFFAALCGTIVAAFSDGKINLLDAPKIFRLIPLTKPAFSGGSELWDEFRDLQDEEREELKRIIAYELDLELDDSPDVSEILENGLDGALAFVKMLTKIKELKKVI